jgi:hypothetical protein
MKALTLITIALLISGCGGDFSTIDAEVEVIRLQPALTVSGHDLPHAVLYRVVAPAELAGKYGVDYTDLSAAEIEKKKGMIFKIQRLGKWRHLLSDTPPKASSVSKGEDFFATAVPK